MNIPVITYDVTLGDSTIVTFTDENTAGNAVEFLAAAVKAGAVFGAPADTPVQYAAASRTASFDDVAAAQDAGATVDFDVIVKAFEAAQPIAPATSQEVPAP